MELGLLRLAIGLYLAGTVAALVGIAVRQDLPRTLLPRLLWTGFVAHGLSIAGRSWTAGHMAVTTFDEALSLLALLLVAVFLVVQLRRPLVALGAVVSPLAFGLTLAADAVYRGVRPLAPGLDSAWLPIHVVLSVLGDAVFALAFSASLLYLVQERRLKARRAPAALRYLPSLETLDRVNYRCLVWGLILLTLGMVSGIVWAHTALGGDAHHRGLRGDRPLAGGRQRARARKPRQGVLKAWSAASSWSGSTTAPRRSRCASGWRSRTGASSPRSAAWWRSRAWPRAPSSPPVTGWRCWPADPIPPRSAPRCPASSRASTACPSPRSPDTSTPTPTARPCATSSASPPASIRWWWASRRSWAS